MRAVCNNCNSKVSIALFLILIGLVIGLHYAKHTLQCIRICNFVEADTENTTFHTGLVYFSYVYILSVRNEWLYAHILSDRLPDRNRPKAKPLHVKPRRQTPSCLSKDERNLWPATSPVSRGNIRFIPRDKLPITPVVISSWNANLNSIEDCHSCNCLGLDRILCSASNVSNIWARISG